MKLSLAAAGKNPLKMLGRVVQPILRSHYYIFGVIVMTSLVVSVYFVSLKLNLPPDEAYRSEQSQSGLNARFDQATISKIERLQRSSQPSSSAAPPSGVRINPFTE